MKKIFTLIVLLFVIGTVSAKIWTVDNTGKVANFTTTTAAVSAASDGDTLLIGGSATAYANITLTKKLVIYGTGYFLTENPLTIETKQPVSISAIVCNYGSSGSEFIGITISSNINISVDASNIILRRCYINYVTVSGNNCLIKQCYINCGVNTWAVNLSGTNNILRNCWVNQTYNGNTLYSLQSNVIENNVITGNFNITGASFGNNIIRSGTATFSNCDPYNNICNDIQCGTTNGNQAYVNITNVFITSGTTDGKWVLSTTSVAKGAGLGGVDCGMYGGNDPYILSGMPDIPVITAITVPGRANLTNGLNVQINIRSNK